MCVPGTPNLGAFWAYFRTSHNVTSFVFNNFLASFPLFYISSATLRPTGALAAEYARTVA